MPQSSARTRGPSRRRTAAVAALLAAVDFWRTGDVVPVVDALNGVRRP